MAETAATAATGNRHQRLPPPDITPSLQRPIDPHERILEVDTSHAVAHTAPQCILDLTTQQGKLIAYQWPDIRLADVQVGVQRRIVVPADAQVAGAGRAPRLGLRFLQQVRGLVEV